MSAAPTENRLVAALIVVQVLFGGIAVAGKFVLPHMPPLAVALSRLMVGAFVLFLLERLVVRSPLPPPQDLARFAGFALLGVVLNQGLFLSGLERTTATNAVLLVATIPAFTLLVAMLLRHERTSARQVAGLAVSFAGVAVLVGGALALGRATLVGDLMIIVNALSYSIYLVVSRPTLGRYDPLTVIAWTFLFGTLQMALVATPQLLAVDWTLLPTEAWLAFLYILIGATVVTYGLNNWVLRHAPASKVASFVYLQPVVGVLLAWLILREPLELKVIVAGLLILGGVYLANRPHPSRRAGRPF